VKISYPPLSSTPNFISQTALQVRICLASPLGKSMASAARLKLLLTLSKNERSLFGDMFGFLNENRVASND
jgi:hypothetical protein